MFLPPHALLSYAESRAEELRHEAQTARLVRSHHISPRTRLAQALYTLAKRIEPTATEPRKVLSHYSSFHKS